MFRSTRWYWWPWGFGVLLFSGTFAWLLFRITQGTGGLWVWTQLLGTAVLVIASAVRVRGGLDVGPDGLVIGAIAAVRVGFDRVRSVEMGPMSALPCGAPGVSRSLSRTGRGAYSLFTARRDHDRFTRRGVEPR